MIKKTYIIYWGMLTLLAFAAGCAGRTEVHPEAIPETASVQKEDPAGRELLDAFIRDDAAAFVRILPDELRKQFGKKEFEQARTELTGNLGAPVSCCFETSLEHPLLNVSLWKVRFKRRGTEGEDLHQEILFRVISGNAESGRVIISFNFL